MAKKMLLAVLFAVMLLAALTVSVSADQEGTSCWCNNDQYGCWITGEKGGRDYIMFWSESARDSIMGKGSKAPIVDRYFAGKLPLECGIAQSAEPKSAEPKSAGPSCTEGEICSKDVGNGTCSGTYDANCVCQCQA